MPKCMGAKMEGKEIGPKSLGKVKRGNYYVPDCPDYSPTINLPTKVRADEVLIGWNCRNCRNFSPT